MHSLTLKAIILLLILTVSGAIFLNEPTLFGDSAWLVFSFIGLALMSAAYVLFNPLGETLEQMRLSSREKGVLGTRPHGKEAQGLFDAMHRERERAMGALSASTSAQGALEAIAEMTEALAKGDGVGRTFSLKGSEDDGAKACVSHLNALSAQMESASKRAARLSAGTIAVSEVESKVMAHKRLDAADMSIERSTGALDASIIELHNQLRRLTIQARVVAADELDSPLLDERLPGELGEAFATMVKNLRDLSERAKGIAKGDLTHFSEQDGDLNSSFNAMVRSLREVVEQITQTAMRISTSAEEILAVLREQELSASHQASGVEETQRTMETLLSSAKRIAESAQTVFKSAERTQANNRIISDRASELKSHTERIGEILESIKAIADRSDLLALNASLEGLRAGEAGKGFTLVANEMRRLAENVKGSVGDIKELLSDIRESALSSVMAIEEGTRLSERTTDSALKITLITQQQQSGTEQVTQSMEELSHLINQGLAGTRQVTMASSELADLSDDLRQLVDAFSTGGNEGAHRGLEAEPLARRASAAAQRPIRATQQTPHHTTERRLSASPTGLATRSHADASSSGEFSLQETSHSGLTFPASNATSGSSSTEKKETRSLQTAMTSKPRATMQVHRPMAEGRGEELNATMRFAGYGDAREDDILAGLRTGGMLESSVNQDSPTMDLSQMAEEEVKKVTGASVEDMDDIFDAVNTPSGATKTTQQRPAPSNDDTSEDETP